MNDPENETVPARDWSEVPYVRVYYSVLTDPKFAKVYSDDAAFAAYVRLLIGAEQTWPMPAAIPAWLGRRVLKLLVDERLLVQQGTLYRISGLDHERQDRFGHGQGRPRYPSDDRTKAKRSRRDVGVESESSRSAPVEDRSLARAGAHSVSVLSSFSENSPAGAREADPYDQAVQWLASRKAWLDSPKVETVLARLVDRKGLAAVIAAMEAVPGAEDGAQFVYGARNRLFPFAASEVTKSPSKDEQDRAEGERQLDAITRRRTHA